MPSKKTFTTGEVAEIADVNLETLRVWLRRDYFDLKREGGWRRFSFFEVMVVACFAAVLKQTDSHDLAREVSRWAYLYSKQLKPGSECFVMAVRRPVLTVEEGRISKFDLTRFDKTRDLAEFTIEVAGGITYLPAPTAFITINLGEIVREVSGRLMIHVQKAAG